MDLETNNGNKFLKRLEKHSVFSENIEINWQLINPEIIYKHNFSPITMLDKCDV